MTKLLIVSCVFSSLLMGEVFAAKEVVSNQSANMVQVPCQCSSVGDGGITTIPTFCPPPPPGGSFYNCCKSTCDNAGLQYVGGSISVKQK